ncbi:hypothetical protein JW877_09415 [bacterium]|nr:hypothetical protein [bacterium]
MKKEILLQELEKIAKKLNLDVRYEKLQLLRGGICRVEESFYLFINKDLPIENQIDLFLTELKRFDLSQIFVLPQIRELLENKDQ